MLHKFFKKLMPNAKFQFTTNQMSKNNLVSALYAWNHGLPIFHGTNTVGVAPVFSSETHVTIIFGFKEARRSK